jgi:hypothetical protein
MAGKPLDSFSSRDALANCHLKKVIVIKFVLPLVATMEQLSFLMYSQSSPAQKAHLDEKPETSID